MPRVGFWTIILDLLLLLAAALTLGTLCELLRQSAIVGYLLAGLALGPHALGLIGSAGEVNALAELGVALLLFTIGLEFSWRRLRSLGPAALWAGVLQVSITLIAAGLGAMLLGFGPAAATAIGAMIALSSTACVLRILVARAEIDSVHGRHVLGILLVQDLAVIPLVLVIGVMGGDARPGVAVLALAEALGLAAVLLGLFIVLFNVLVPRVLQTGPMQRNRELPTLLAIVVALGSAWAAHWMGLSPALGAFAAGVLLAASPFATQVRADVASLRTVLMTLFFSSVGMLADPAWMVSHALELTGLVILIVVGKALVIWPVLWRLGVPPAPALASGLCLAQIGEFSFVLAETGRAAGVVIDALFQAIVSTTIVTLFLTPYLVTWGPAAAHGVIERLRARRLIRGPRAPAEQPDAPPQGHVIVVGFGPAGQEVARSLVRRAESVTVVDLSRRALAAAHRMGMIAQIGDATQAEVLDHAHLASAAVVVITVPDPVAARTIVQLARARAPDAQVIARARYHVYRWELEHAGAHVVIDEEQQVGRLIAAVVRRHLPRGVEP
jgi:CPA2 family monovalent cation:H+ antiporter-2